MGDEEAVRPEFAARTAVVYVDSVRRCGSCLGSADKEENGANEARSSMRPMKAE
jgi:hypothetical protein